MNYLKRTSAIIITVVVLLSLFVFPANAAKNSGKHSNIKWSVNTKTGRLTISGKGKMADFSADEEEYMYDDAPWSVYYSDVIKSVVIKNGVTTIGREAFNGLTNLKSVTMANTIKSINRYAFLNCKKLKTVKFSNKLKMIEYSAFGNCKSLTSVKIPKSVKTIGTTVFDGCKKLKKITLPDSVNSIGYDAFKDTAYYNNSKNRKNGALYIGKHLIHVKESVKGKVKVKKGTKTIAQWAMFNNDNITSVSIPASVRYLNKGYVCNCFGIKSFKVDGKNKFFATEKSVLFNNNKTKLINYPPKKTSESYTIPESVTVIGSSAFENCENLKSVTMGGKLTTIGEAAFENCTKLASVSIPSGVSKIDNYAFMGCESLASVKLPEKIKRINCFAFSYCGELKEVVIPDSVKSIDDGAFKCCKKLEKIVIPASVTSIDLNAFVDDEDVLENLVFYGYANTKVQDFCQEFSLKFIDIKTGTEYN